MNRENSLILKEDQVFEIKKLASATRQSFGVFQNVPIGNDIRLLLEKKGIFLCEYPYPDTGGTHTYGNITWFKADEGDITFIGLNTSSYYDEQVFALAHELYHYSTKTGKAYIPDIEVEDQLTERQADRFAAELLLPAEALKDVLHSMFGTASMHQIPDLKIVRGIARLQCDWWLPYRSIVNRLYEEDLIDEGQYGRLFAIDCRSEQSVYRRILKSTDSEISELLNKKTRSIGISRVILETVICNYEDGLIDDDEFLDLMRLFGKDPEDYGFDMVVEPDEDLMELIESEVDE